MTAPERATKAVPAPTKTPAGQPVVPAHESAGQTAIAEAGWPVLPGFEARTLMALQRSAGNRAVATMLDGDKGSQAVQRQGPGHAGAAQPRTPPPPPATNVANQISAMQNRQASLALDAEYHAKVNQRLSTYREGIYLLTAGFQTATNQFQATMTQQAQSDAIKSQLIIAIVSVGAAVGMEPLLALGLGQLAPKLTNSAAFVTKWTERLENPLIAAASSGIQVQQAVATSGNPAARSAPAVGGGVAGGGADPVTFLAQNLAALERNVQSFEGSFSASASAQQSTPDSAWAAWNPQTARAAYELMLNSLDAVQSPPASVLKAPGALAEIIERYMWAAWITRNYRYVSDTLIGDNDQISGLGNDIEDRLNTVNVSRLAGVTLTGHWYSGNSSHYADALRAWAQTYAEKITLR